MYTYLEDDITELNVKIYEGDFMKPIAVITGATSGIGKAYAYALAKQGYDLILTGRREKLLCETAQFVQKAYGCKTYICLVDFRDETAFKRFLKWIDRFSNIQILINNAGYGTESSFMKDEYSNQYDMVKVHIHATIALTHLIGNKMKKERKGSIVNVCSLAAYIPLPSSAMYAATKDFLIRFSEALYLELGSYGVHVQALCPGFVHTDFHHKLSISKDVLKSRGLVRFMNPQDVVKYSLHKLTCLNQVIVIPGICNKLGYVFLKTVPRKPYYITVNKGIKHFNMGQLKKDIINN